MNPEFLDVGDVLEIHRFQLERFGGSAGLRDRGLLESAVAQPEGTFGGEFLHGDLFLMAAAYLYHIVRNHPFVDGNKRAGLLSALVFLDVNGISIAHSDPQLYDLTLAVAEGRLEKEALSESLRKLASHRE